jgi:hypothetical protein
MNGGRKGRNDYEILGYHGVEDAEFELLACNAV